VTRLRKQFRIFIGEKNGNCGVPGRNGRL